MQKEQIIEIQTAFARLSDSLISEIPSLEAKLTHCLAFAVQARHPLHEPDVEAICDAASNMDRACQRLRELSVLRREFGPVLEKIVSRVRATEERRLEHARWTHAVAAHCLGGAEVWEYAGTLAECMHYAESQRDDDTPEEYSIRPMSLLQPVQRLAAMKKRRRIAHDLLDEDIPF